MIACCRIEKKAIVMSLDICLSINTSRFSSVNTTPVHQQLDGLDFGDAYVLSHLLPYRLTVTKFGLLIHLREVDQTQGSGAPRSKNNLPLILTHSVGCTSVKFGAVTHLGIGRTLPSESEG